RGNQGDQHVLIDGQLPFLAVVLVEIVAEPVRERLVDPRHRLAKGSPGKRRAAATRVVADDQRKPLILRSSPQRRLPQPGMAVYGYAALVDIRVGLEIIHRAA